MTVNEYYAKLNAEYLEEVAAIAMDMKEEEINEEEL